MLSVTCAEWWNCWWCRYYGLEELSKTMKILSVGSLCPNQDPNPAFRSVISLFKLTCMVKLCLKNMLCVLYYWAMVQKSLEIPGICVVAQTRFIDNLYHNKYHL